MDIPKPNEYTDESWAMQMAMEMCGCAWRDMAEALQQYCKTEDSGLKAKMSQMTSDLARLHNVLRQKLLALRKADYERMEAEEAEGQA